MCVGPSVCAASDQPMKRMLASPHGVLWSLPPAPVLVNYQCKKRGVDFTTSGKRGVDFTTSGKRGVDFTTSGKRGVDFTTTKVLVRKEVLISLLVGKEVLISLLLKYNY